MDKAQFQHIKYADRRIDSKIEELERIRSLAERTTCTLSFSPKCHEERDKLAALTGRIIALEREINESIDLFIDTKKNAHEAIGKLKDGAEAAVMEARYLVYHSWERIARDMDLPLRTIYRLHGKALEKLRKEKSV